jgi:hypothetical protein
VVHGLDVSDNVSIIDKVVPVTHVQFSQAKLCSAQTGVVEDLCKLGYGQIKLRISENGWVVGSTLVETENYVADHDDKK